MKKVKWLVKQLYGRKLKHGSNAWMKREEELSGAKLGQSPFKEPAKVYICPREQG